MIASIGTNARNILLGSCNSRLWPRRLHQPGPSLTASCRRHPASHGTAMPRAVVEGGVPEVRWRGGPGGRRQALACSFPLRSASPINRGNRRNCQAHGLAGGCGTPRPEASGAREALRDPLGLAAEGCGQSLHSCILPGLRHSRTQRGWAKSGWPFRPPVMCLANNPSLIQHNLGFYHPLRCCDRRKCSFWVRTFPILQWCRRSRTRCPCLDWR